MDDFDVALTQQATQTQQAHTQSQSQSEPSQDVNESWGVLLNSAAGPGGLEEGKPNRIELGRDGTLSYVLGRNPKADVFLSGKKISSAHCKVWVDEDRQAVRLQDLSTNGTYVRDKKIGKGNVTLLEHGDEIIFGPTHPKQPHLDFRYLFQNPTSSSTLWGASMIGGSEAADSDLVNDKSGIEEKYDVREQIGKGSFATVRKGLNKTTGEKVAIKVIQKARFINNPKTMAMIRREVDIMRKLNHEFCVKYIDYYEDEQRIWLVMEYVDGGDLLEFVMSQSGLDEKTTREIAYMVCQAVAYLHSVGIAHRDLKPENLLLAFKTTKGQRKKDDKMQMICKVTDFGLAKAGLEQGTYLKTMCGTPTYLAPEVILNPNPAAGYGPAVDAWSIGVVLYSCLTNSTPFDESESTPLPERVRARKVQWADVQNAGVSDAGQDFLKRLLVVDQYQRMKVHEALQHPWLRTTDGPATNLLKPHPSLITPATAAHQEQTPDMLDSPDDKRPFGLDSEIGSFGQSFLREGMEGQVDGYLTLPGEGSVGSFSQKLGNFQLNSPARSASFAAALTPGQTDVPDEEVQTESHTVAGSPVVASMPGVNGDSPATAVGDNMEADTPQTNGTKRARPLSAWSDDSSANASRAQLNGTAAAGGSAMSLDEAADATVIEGADTTVVEGEEGRLATLQEETAADSGDVPAADQDVVMEATAAESAPARSTRRSSARPPPAAAAEPPRRTSRRLSAPPQEETPPATRTRKTTRADSHNDSPGQQTNGRGRKAPRLS